MQKEKASVQLSRLKLYVVVIVDVDYRILTAIRCMKQRICPRHLKKRLEVRMADGR